MTATVGPRREPAHPAGFTIGGGASFTPDSGSRATARRRLGGSSWRTPVPITLALIRGRFLMRLDDDVIQLDGVTKTYQAGTAPALDDLSLGVAAGEVVAVMGPSGR